MTMDSLLVILSLGAFLQKTPTYWTIWSIVSGSFMAVYTLFGFLRTCISLSRNVKVIAMIANTVVWLSFITFFLGIRDVISNNVAKWSLAIVVPSVFLVIGRLFISIAKKISENPLRKKNIQHRNLIYISYFTLISFCLTAIPCVIFAFLGAFLESGMIFELAISMVSYVKLILSISNACIIINKILIFNIMENGQTEMSIFKTQQYVG